MGLCFICFIYNSNSIVDYYSEGKDMSALKKRSANEVPLIVWVAYLLGIQIGILISITTIIMYGGI